MKQILTAILIVLCALLWETEANAAACTYTFNDATPTLQTVNVFCDGSGHFYPFFTPTDTSGNVAVGTAAAGTAGAASLTVGALFNSTAPTLTNGQQAALQLSARGGLLLGNGYPAGSTAITISATGTTTATTATMATGASITTYICGFSIRANATAAATNNATVTGTITGTLNFTQWTAPLASGIGIVEQIFQPCIPASGTNQAIAVVSGAPGSGGTVSVTAWGYTL